MMTMSKSQMKRIIALQENSNEVQNRVNETPSALTSERGKERPLGFVKPDNDRQVFFYEQDFYVLSNFSAFNVVINGQTFETSEAAYHWFKFPDEPQVQLAILHARSAHEAFKIAEGHKHLRRADWDDVKADIMLEILREKAEQHEYVRRKLLTTGDRELIEDSWRDDYWGWGPNRDGQNMLGKLWMRVRTELREAVGDQLCSSVSSNSSETQSSGGGK